MKILKRFTTEEEYGFMSPVKEAYNMTFLKGKAINYFFYNDETNLRIKDRIDNGGDSDNRFLDDLLSLNDQKRAFYEVENDREIDPSFLTYKNEIERRFFYGYIPDIFFKFCNKNKLAEYNVYQSLINYESFLSNRVKIGNQSYRLIKFITDYGLIKPEKIEEITHAKNKSKTLTLCVSRNPIDYIFASTNQSFRSCISLKTKGQIPGLGLLGLILDPNRFMMFYTKGKLTTHNLKEVELYHFTYQSRWWNILGENNIVCPLPMYPHKKQTNFESQCELLTQIGAKPSETNLPQEFNSKYIFKPARFIDNNISMIFLDRIGLFRNDEDSVSYSIKDGATGCCIPYNTPYSFYKLRDFEDLARRRNYCNRCGTSLEGIQRYVINEQQYCYICYRVCHFTCDICENVGNVNNRYTYDNMEMCSECWNQQFYSCDGCE